VSQHGELDEDDLQPFNLLLLLFSVGSVEPWSRPKGGSVKENSPGDRCSSVMYRLDTLPDVILLHRFIMLTTLSRNNRVSGMV